MPKHYQLLEEKHGAKCIRCISEILVDFSMNLGPVFRVRPEAKPSQCVCVSSQKRASECAWMAKGRKQTLFELGAVQTQTVHGSLCETEKRTKDPLTLQTLPAVQSEVCMCVCVCACARVHALVPVHSCGQIQIWSHTLCQCSLFNVHRYVNFNAKACIWCIRKVYPKGEES